MTLKVRQLIDLQQKLAKEVRLLPLGKPIRTIAGVDVSSNLYGKTLYAGIVLMSYPELEVLEEVTHEEETDFPYIPGLLSFRELPAILECVKKLSTRPDVYIVDGQGIAHPRGLGIAAHLGVLLDAPTIGCAKSVLFGIVEGDRLLHPKSCRIIGKLMKSKKRSNPLIISPGHKLTLEEAEKIVLRSLSGYKLPEPTRLAHNLVNAFRKGEIKNK